MPKSRYSFESCTLHVSRVLRITVSQDPCRLAVLKADIDSAYRRVPVAPEHREFARIVFKHEEQIWEAGHLGMPFGSLASLHGWDRIGQHLLEF